MEKKICISSINKDIVWSHREKVSDNPLTIGNRLPTLSPQCGNQLDILYKNPITNRKINLNPSENPTLLFT